MKNAVIAPNGEQLWRAAVDEREKPDRKCGYNNLWSPVRCTVAYIETVPIGLTIIEMSEEVEARYIKGKYIREADYVPPERGRHLVDQGWTTRKAFATGRLCLQAYSPHPLAKWVHQWRETKDHNLLNHIPAMIKELERAVGEVARLIEGDNAEQRWSVNAGKSSRHSGGGKRPSAGWL